MLTADQLDDNEKFIREELAKAWKDNADLHSLIFDYWYSHQIRFKSEGETVLASGYFIGGYCGCTCCDRAVKFLRGIQ